MARDVHDVVKGILPLFSGHAFVLFGSRAVHSFVSSTCVKFCAEVPMPLDCTLTVATPVGDHLCEACQMGKQVKSSFKAKTRVNLCNYIICLVSREL